MAFFEHIYLLLNGFYSESLMNYLSGYDCSTNEFTAANVYGHLGLWTLGVSVVMAVVYYKVWDPVIKTRWWLTLAGNAAIAFVVAYCMVTQAESKGEIGACLLKDDNGNALIATADYIGLGLSNVIIAVVFYALISFFCKYISTNNRYTPF